MGWTRIFPNDFFTIMESPTSIRPFLRHTAFEFWSRHFTVVTILGSQREDICTAAMHGYWQVVMTSFEQELLGNHGFSLIPLDGLSVVISANPQLLVPTKSVVAYAKKQSRFAIFKWVEEERGWFWYAGDYPTGWEKRMKVTNISVPMKKSSAKAKSTKKGDDSSETCSNIVPLESDLPPVGNIVLKRSPPPFAHTCLQ